MDLIHAVIDIIEENCLQGSTGKVSNSDSEDVILVVLNVSKHISSNDGKSLSNSYDCNLEVDTV